MNRQMEEEARSINQFKERKNEHGEKELHNPTQREVQGFKADIGAGRRRRARLEKKKRGGRKAGEKGRKEMKRINENKWVKSENTTQIKKGGKEGKCEQLGEIGPQEYMGEMLKQKTTMIQEAIEDTVEEDARQTHTKKRKGLRGKKGENKEVNVKWKKEGRNETMCRKFGRNWQEKEAEVIRIMKERRMEERLKGRRKVGREGGENWGRGDKGGNNGIQNGGRQGDWGRGKGVGGGGKGEERVEGKKKGTGGGAIPAGGEKEGKSEGGCGERKWERGYEGGEKEQQEKGGERVKGREKRGGENGGGGEKGGRGEKGEEERGGGREKGGGEKGEREKGGRENGEREKGEPDKGEPEKGGGEKGGGEKGEENGGGETGGGGDKGEEKEIRRNKGGGRCRRKREIGRKRGIKGQSREGEDHESRERKERKGEGGDIKRKVLEFILVTVTCMNIMQCFLHCLHFPSTHTCTVQHLVAS